MPRYDYSCDECGRFTAWRPMSEYAEPSECPTCGSPAPRAVTAPFIADMNPHTRIAHERNEKSAHEPQVESRRAPDRPDADRSGREDYQRAYGGRPWMLGH